MRTLAGILVVLSSGVSRADTFAYVSLAKDRKIAVYKIDPATGSLTHIADAPCEGEPGALVALRSGFSERNACAEIKVHPTGKFLYVSNRGHDSIARFQIDSATGKLTAQGQTATEKTPRSFDLDPSCNRRYVCGEATNRIAAYQIDPMAGGLTPLATVSIGKTPWWIAIVELPKPK